MKKIISTILLSVLLSSCQTQSANKEDNSNLKLNSEQITNKINEVFPGVKGKFSVSLNKDLNLYQVYLSGQVIYLTLDGQYFIDGHYFKLNDPTKKDYTQDFIQSKMKVNPEIFPLDLAIKSVKGNGKNIYYIFSDPDCPYCHLLQTNIINKLDNYTIYTFMSPLDSIHPHAHEDAVKILCSKNSNEDLEKWLNVDPSKIEVKRNDFFKNLKTCDTGETKLSELYKLMNSVMINGTPTVFDGNGNIINPTKILDKN